MSSHWILLCPELFVAPGGIARVSRHYLQAMSEAREGRELTLIALNDEVISSTDIASCQADAAKAVACGRSKLSCALALWRAAGRGPCHITCLHPFMAPLAALVQTFRRGVSYDVVVHGIEVWSGVSPRQARALQAARHIFSVSAYTRDELLRHQPELAGKIEVVPNALDPGFAAVSADTATSPHEGPPILLAVSRLATHDHAKGIDHLITALPAVQKAHPGTMLRIVGEGEDRARLESIAAALPEPATVQFLGRIDDKSLHQEYAACDLFVLPSKKEGFGLVYLEAMAAGKPCIVADAGAAPEVIDKHSGRVTPYGDPSTLAHTINQALNMTWEPAQIVARAKSFAFPAFAARWRALSCPAP